MREIIVKSERLCLRPRNLAEMETLSNEEPDPEMKQAYGDMLRAMRVLPGREEWGTEWEIRLNTGSKIGGIGFKGAPDTNGTVEIGYGIDEAYRRQGYAAESVSALVRWALAQEGVRLIIAQTEANNLVSQRVLLKNGFVQEGFGEEGPLYLLKK